MQGNIALGNGQVAITTAATIASLANSTQSQRVNITFTNVGLAEETLVVTVVNSGGTARRLFRAVLQVDEQAVMSGVPLDGNDVIKAVTTTAESVDYVVSKASDEAPFAVVTYDANGAVKNAQSGVNATGGVSYPDGAKAKFGDADDITMAWDGTDFDVLQATANSSISWGVDGAGIDQIWYGDTASAKLTWDQSADKLIVGGAASIQGLRTSSSSATAITTTRVLTLADAGGIFEIDQDAAFDIDVPDPTTGPGCRYTFVITDAGAQNVTITCAGAATFVGNITIDGTTIPATGATLTFASGSAGVGDSIEVVSISTTLYLVRAFASAAGGITIA